MALGFGVGRRWFSLWLLGGFVCFLIFLALAAAWPHFELGDVLDRYGSYIGALSQADLGRTDRGEPVGQLILRTFFKSFGVLALAVGLAGLIGVAIGLVANARSSRPNEAWPVAISVVLLSAPSFLIGGLLQSADVEIAIRTGVLPLPTTGFGWDRHLVMPVLVLAAKPTAYVARVTSQVLQDTLRQGHIKTAYAKGLPARAVLLKHGLWTSGASVLAALALAMRLSVGMLPIVEMVFVYPGIGFVFLSAIRAQDVVAASGLAMTLALSLWVLNAALEAARRWLDPRLGVPTALGDRML